MELNFKQVVNKLKNITGKNLSYNEIAKVLNVKKCTVNVRISRGTPAKKQDVIALKEYLCIPPTIDIAGEVEECPYVYIDFYKTPYIVSVWGDRLFKPLILDKYGIKTEWKLDYNNLRLIPMIGDKMQSSPNHHLNIMDGNVLVMDISSRDIRRSGIYTYETLGGAKLQISNVNIMVNGNVRFSYANENYGDEVRTPEELKALQFKVIGRIIKNMSFVHK